MRGTSRRAGYAAALIGGLGLLGSVSGCGSSNNNAAAAPTPSRPVTQSPSATPTATPGATFDVATVCAAWRSAADLQKQTAVIAQRSYDYQTAAQQKFDADMATVLAGMPQAPGNVRSAAAELRADVSFHPSDSSDSATSARVGADVTTVDNFVTDGCPNE